MKLIAKLLLAAVTAACVATGASAAYPDKPIRLIVPFPAGGTVNLIGRVLAQRLSETLGQQVIVENKPGAGGTLGADLVAKSAPDGYTLLLASSSHQSIHPLIYRKLPYDASKDFVQVALFAAVPNVLVVSNKVPAKTVKDFVAYAKSGGKRCLWAPQATAASTRWSASCSSTRPAPASNTCRSRARARRRST